MSMQQIPRTVVRTWLRAARLPVSVAERVVQRDGSSRTFAPAVAFDTVDADVRQLVGTLLRDDELVQEGRLRQAKVAQLRDAAQLEAEAERRRIEADAEFERRREADEQQRERVRQQAEQREAEAERLRIERERKAAAKAAKEAEAARQAKAAADKAVAKQERAARATRITAEQRALAEEREAVEAAGKVVELDQELRETKAARAARR